MHARLVLARAVTNAVRYLCVRRQFHDRDNPNPRGPEMAVMDYPTVQIRVLPLVATSFALHYTGRAMGEQYAATRASIEKGDFSPLADLHAASSGLKSLCTTYAADGIETCRRAMGGHGFGGRSGMIALNNDYLSKPTVEGDNWMITQQTASYLLKKMTEFATATSAHKPQGPYDIVTEPFTSFLQSKSSGKLDEQHALPIMKSDEAIVKAFERRAAHLAYQVYTLREVDKKPWNDLLIQFHHLSNAFCQSILVRNFYYALYPSSAAKNDSTIPSGAHATLLTCFRLFAFNTIHNNARDFSRSSAISNDDLDDLPHRILELMADVRRHAVRLVDAWSIPDYLLDSSLGRYDGRVYEDLFHHAHRLNPLNKETFNPYYWTEEIVMGDKESGDKILSKL